MKARLVMLIDYDHLEGFLDAGEEELQVRNFLATLVKNNKKIIHSQVVMKERRGDKSPDLNTMAFRAN